MALIVVDFDGTITESDSLVEIVQTHAPQLFDELEGDLDAGRITLRQCIEREFAAVRGDHDTIVAEAVGRVRVRAGFAEFVAAAQAAGHRVVVVSSGFEAIIRPVLLRDGVGEVELFAHEVRFSAEGGVVEFRHGEECDVCGQECKRSVVARCGTAATLSTWVTATPTAARRWPPIACSRGARWPGTWRREGVAYEPFDDFVERARGAGRCSYSAVV